MEREVLKEKQVAAQLTLKKYPTDRNRDRLVTAEVAAFCDTVST